VSAAKIDNPLFSLTGSLPLQLAPGQQQAFTVQFSPAGAGDQSGTLTISSNDAGSPATVALTGTGAGTGVSAPKLSLSTTSLSFGNVTVGQTKDLSLTASNLGTAPLTIASAAVTGAGFSLTSAASFTVASGGSQMLTVHYAPTSATPSSGTLTITSNDPSSPVSVSLSGTGVAAAAPAIGVTPSSVDFGSVAVGQTKDLMIAIGNTGGAALIVSSIASNNARFSVIAPSTPIQVSSGGQQQVTIRFAPNAAGSQSATLTITSNDPNRPSASVSLTGTGTSAQPATVVLQVDGGTFGQAFGFPNGQMAAAFVNRLTPPSYPATIQNVQIYFGNRPDGLAPNTPITILYGANPSGTASFNTTLTQVPAVVNSSGVFNVYPVMPTTITSGDFIVGFIVNDAAGIYPVDVDTATPSKQRSYFAAGNLSFTLLDSFSSSGGNFAIRATASLQ
jgi:hypothetical protein